MKANPKLSAIAHGDLGLKAAYWNHKEGEVHFLPIVGWVSVTNYVQAGTHPFAALVLSADHRPVFANAIVDFAGTFPRDSNAVQVAEQIKNRKPTPPSTHQGPLE